MKHLPVILAEFCVIALFFLPKPETSPVELSPRSAAIQPSENVQISEQIRVILQDKTVEMELEEYIFGVVCAEMPMSWPEEAVKAQAVAARTYALYQKSAKKHENGDVCGDSSCCQAYKTQAELETLWGENAAFYVQKARQAVADTAGEVVVYGGEPAATVYHASSVGSTNAAEEVWGRAVDYLVAVETQSEEEAKGHGVGMSQWGAKALAQEGKTYREILAHYYPGTTLEKR